MNDQDFSVVVKECIDNIEKVLAGKAKEYSSEDRLHNFKIAARVGKTTPAKALWGMAMKHLVSVLDFIDEVRKPTKESLDEKIGDLINYLILLKAIYIDEITYCGIKNGCLSGPDKNKRKYYCKRGCIYCRREKEGWVCDQYGRVLEIELTENSVDIIAADGCPLAGDKVENPKQYRRKPGCSFVWRDDEHDCITLRFSDGGYIRCEECLKASEVKE